MITSPEVATPRCESRLGTATMPRREEMIMYTAAELKKLGVYIKGVTSPRTHVVESTVNGQVVVRPVKIGWVTVS